MLKVLLTGFTKFGNNQINPTELLVNQFAMDEVFLQKVILPVEFYMSFDEIKTHIDSFNPELILLCGLASEREKISLEKVAINYIDAGIPDNALQQPRNKKINLNEQDGIFTNIDVFQLVESLKDRSIDICQSYSAGSYVCNYLYFEVLNYTKLKNIKTLFIHFPPVDEKNTLEFFDDVLRSIIKKINKHEK